ncbi:MAG TPA: aminopeptidase [Gammaproteobacteria bacterium]|nr:aminopeptidase [Gammaproteobacteria bacterium]
MRSLRLLFAIVAAGSASGCTTLAYYGQAIGGQLDILARSQSIDELLDEQRVVDSDERFPQTPVSPQLRQRLLTVQRIRRFATEELRLPDNGSYTVYADLERPMVAWNVIATPEFSFKAKTWCYPFAGCVPYRGYFSHHRADSYAAELRAEGLDVRVAGVAAYSTLGWFRDPVLNTQVKRNDVDLAALIFHELAHQTMYLPGEAAFNESFATTVETEGLRRWQAANGSPAEFEQHRMEQARHAEFVALVLDARAKLEPVYASAATDSEKRSAKAEHMTALRNAYALLKKRWNGDDRYDRWFAEDLNNAHLASVELYHQLVPAFQALLEESGRNLDVFYQQVRALSRLTPEARMARLQELGGERLSAR